MIRMPDKGLRVAMAEMACGKGYAWPQATDDGFDFNDYPVARHYRLWT